jgi:TRAP-type C4-dicarboxylate transport system permease small subunit
MPERPKTPFERAARPFGLAAAALLVFMMMLTVVAVLAREFLDYSMLSLVEWSEFALLGVIFIALPGVFLRDEHIVVDIIDQLVSARCTNVLYLIGLLLGIAFLVGAAYAMIEPTLDKYHSNQHTLVMEINRFYHWIPILFGIYISILAAVWLFVHRLRGGGAAVPSHEFDYD